MKKIILTLISVIVFGHFSYAQWTTGTNIYNTNTGNVGIGTSSPVAKLHVLNTTQQLLLGYDVNNYTSFTTTSNGSLNIGLTTNANNLLSIDFLGTTSSPQLRLFKNTPTAGGSFAIYQGPNGDPSFGAQDYFAANGSSYLNALVGNLTVGKPGGGLSNVSVAGNLAIGSTYYNTAAAPADGLLVQGNVNIGTTSTSATTASLNIGSSSTRGTVGIIGSPTQAPVITLVDSQTGGRGYSIYSGLSVPGFQIFDQSASPGAFRFMIDPSGNVGIGIINPAGLLSLNNQISIGNDPINYAVTTTTGQTVFNSYYAMNTDGYGGYPRYLDIASVGVPAATTGGGNIRFLTNPVGAGSPPAIERMRIASNGTVFIGTPLSYSSTYLLNVNGFVRANEVVVNVTGADFVFDPSYKLSPLADLKKYIDQNHHLPEIASAKQMQAEGLNLGENELKLLQKIEELTLYLIESDKVNKEQQALLKSQQLQLSSQQMQIDKLTKAFEEMAKKQTGNH